LVNLILWATRIERVASNAVTEFAARAQSELNCRTPFKEKLVFAPQSVGAPRLCNTSIAQTALISTIFLLLISQDC